MAENWYAKSIPEILESLGAHEHGLSAEAVAERVREFGPNELPKEKDVLSKLFTRPGKYLVDRLMLVRMVLMALPMVIGTLYLFTSTFEIDLTKAWTVSLTVLAVSQWMNAWNCRSETESIFRMNPFSNKYLVAATFAVIALQLLAVYTPFLQGVLHTTSLSSSEWILIVLVALPILLVEEFRKLIVRTARTVSNA